MRKKSFLIILGCLISCSLIISIPIIPAIENQQIQDTIKTKIENLINNNIIIDNNINIDFNSIINLILLLLYFLKDLTDIFIAIMVSLFDYISEYLIEIQNLINDINPIFKIMILTVVYIYILLMFTVLTLMVQFSGILIILYLILENLFPSYIEFIK